MSLEHTEEYSKIVNFYENVKRQTRLALQNLAQAGALKQSSAEEISNQFFSEIRDQLGEMLEIAAVQKRDQYTQIDLAEAAEGPEELESYNF